MFVPSGPPGTHELSDVRLKLMKDHRQHLANNIPTRIADIKTIATECYQIQTDLVLEEEGFETVPNTNKFLPLDENIMEFGKTGEFLFSVHSDELKMLKETLDFLDVWVFGMFKTEQNHIDFNSKVILCVCNSF